MKLTIATTKAAGSSVAISSGRSGGRLKPGSPAGTSPTTAPPCAAKPVHAEIAIVAATTSGTPGRRGHRRLSATSATRLPTPNATAAGCSASSPPSARTKSTSR